MAALAVALVMASCVAPAISDSAYRSKAAKTAEDAVSALETLNLALTSEIKHGLPSNPIEVAIREQEDILGSVSGTFASVQPPGPEMDTLRSGVLDPIEEALSLVEQARVEFRRGRFDRAAELIAKTKPLSKKLDEIAARYTE